MKQRIFMVLSHLPSIFAIIVIGFVLRVTWAASVDVIPVSDGVVYDMFAQNIASGRGYVWNDGQPTVYWPVGASALYGAIYLIFGYSLVWVAVLNVLLGTLLILVIYWVASIRFDQGVARLAALIAAIWPSWISFTTILSSELPATLFMMVGLGFALERRIHVLPRLILASLFLTTSAYMRPTILPLIVVIPILTELSRNWSRPIFALTISAAVAAFCIAPWAHRNAVHFGSPVLISANFGANLWMGNNPQSNGGYMELPSNLPLNEVDRDRLLAHRAIAFIRSHFGQYLKLALRRFVMTFSRESIGVVWNSMALPLSIHRPLKILMAVYWLFFFGLSLVGLSVYFRRYWPTVVLDPLVVTPVFLASIPILVVGMDRYHFGLMPFVAIFASLAVQSMTLSDDCSRRL